MKARVGQISFFYNDGIRQSISYCSTLVVHEVICSRSPRYSHNACLGLMAEPQKAKLQCKLYVIYCTSTSSFADPDRDRNIPHWPK